MGKFLRVTFGLGLVVCSTSGVSRAVVQNLIVAAQADDKGQMHIRMKDGAERVVPADKEQVGVDAIKIAADGSVVGWLVEIPNCCTSYPTAVEIKVFSLQGGVRDLGDGMMIGDWKFLEGGKEIAYITDTVHGNLRPQCELVETSTGKTVGHWERGRGALPGWAKSFAEQVGALRRAGS